MQVDRHPLLLSSSCSSARPRSYANAPTCQCLLTPHRSTHPLACTGMLSRQATMALLLLRATAALAWVPAALGLNRSVTAKSCRYVGSQRCRSRTFPPGSSITRNGSCSNTSSRSGVRTFATSKTTISPTGAVVGDGGSDKQGFSTEGQGVGEQEDAAAASAAVTEANTIGGVEIQPLLQPHMELLGSAGRRK